MRSLVALTSLLTLLLLTAALGTAADAKCRLCIESISAQGTGSAGWGRTIDLRFVARASDGVFPDGATAVVMQVDGDRTKCITVALRRTGATGELATYGGTFQAYGQTTHSGRLDLGGDVYDFTVPLNGEQGTVQPVGTAPAATAAAVRPQTVAVPAVPAVPVATQAAQPAAAEPQATPLIDLSSPDRQGLLLGLAVIAFTVASVFVERRRALLRRARATAEA